MWFREKLDISNNSKQAKEQAHTLEIQNCGLKYLLTVEFQRISLKYHLNPLSQAETKAYILHQLKLAGAVGPEILCEAAYEAIFNLSKGIPRVIGAIATKAFLACSISKKRSITEDDILSVSQEVL